MGTRGWVLVALAVSGCSAGPGPGLFRVATHDLLAPRMGHTATRLPSGQVLVAGAVGSPSAFGPEIFSPDTGAFAAARGSLDAAVWTATSLENGQVFLSGAGTVSLFDASTETFTAVSGSAVAHFLNHTATRLRDGRVLLIGRSGDVSVVELYDPQTSTFRRISGPAVPRTLATATLLADGRVLLAGGMGPAGAVDLVDLYDPATDLFESASALPTPQYLHTATLLSDGRVLIAGGEASTESAGAVLFDPATGDFTRTPRGLITPRARHTATRLADGRVLLAGGLSGDGSGSTVSAELFDPATGLFQATTNTLHTRRMEHTATLLGDGRVLIIGGQITSDGSIAGAEIYW